MKVEIWNTRAGMLSAFGVLGTVMIYLLTLVLAANFDPSYIAGWIPAATAVLWATIEGFRNANYTLEYDEAGLRAHSIGAWDVPWREVTDVAVVDDMIDRRLVIQVAPDQRPANTRGWFNGAYGQRPTTRIVPYPVKKRPRPPKGVALPKGPRAVSTVWRMRNPLTGAIGAFLLTAATLTMLLGHWHVGVGFLLALIGLVGGAMAAFGLPGRRSVAVVDGHGVRQVGQQHWTLPWQYIASAQVVAGTLVVTPDDDSPGFDAPIQDSFQVDDDDDDEDDDDEDGEPRRRGRGNSLVQRMTSNARLKASLADSNLTTAPVAARDAVALQQTIDHYLSAWKQSPASPGQETLETAALEIGPDPSAWPIVADNPDQTESPIQDEYQPRPD